MLGEASHGTHEYYTWRTAISKRLIREKGFRFIAVEGDWPDCYRINRFIKGYPTAGDDIRVVLETFDRWPTWMWANWEIAALAEWLREHNTPLRPAFNAEQNALIAVNAENYYRNMVCFDNETWNIRDRNMMETLDRLLRFHEQAASFAQTQAAAQTQPAAQAHEQAAQAAAPAQHKATPAKSPTQAPKVKALVWAHNTHVGDARATNMHVEKMINIGQLAREQYGNENVYLIGFSGYSGTVIAGEGWGWPMQVMEVPEARPDSIEGLLHRQSTENRYILSAEAKAEGEELPTDRTRQCAIGVVYDPERDAMGNYVPSLIPLRYDALIYLDQTIAIHPLHLAPPDEKMPETYPFGI